MDDNEMRAKNVLERFGFNFKEEYRKEIRLLLEEEFDNYQPGSSEYLRALCGYLFCIGNPDDLELIEKIKWGINMDVGVMIGSEWINSMKGMSCDDDRTREELIEEYISYYEGYIDP